MHIMVIVWKRIHVPQIVSAFCHFTATNLNVFCMEFHVKNQYKVV